VEVGIQRSHDTCGRGREQVLPRARPLAPVDARTSAAITSLRVSHPASSSTSTLNRFSSFTVNVTPVSMSGILAEQFNTDRIAEQ
jgi:hypothetical protein